MLYSGLQSAMGSSGFNISLAVSVERHALPQTGMAGCDYEIFSVWEPGEGTPHMAWPSPCGYEKGAMQGLVVESWPPLVQTGEQQKMGIEICPSSEQWPQPPENESPLLSPWWVMRQNSEMFHALKQRGCARIKFIQLLCFLSCQCLQIPSKPILKNGIQVVFEAH